MIDDLYDRMPDFERWEASQKAAGHEPVPGSKWTKIAPVARRLGIGRREAFRVACPRCGSEEGEQCIGMRSPRQLRLSPHAERYETAIRYATGA